MIRANRHEIGTTTAIMTRRKAEAFVVKRHAPKLAWRGLLVEAALQGSALQEGKEPG